MKIYTKRDCKYEHEINQFIVTLPKRDTLIIDYSHEISPGIYESKTYTEYERLEYNNVNIKYGDLNVNENLRHKFNKNIYFTPEELVVIQLTVQQQMKMKLSRTALKILNYLMALKFLEELRTVGELVYLMQ